MTPVLLHLWAACVPSDPDESAVAAPDPPSTSPASEESAGPALQAVTVHVTLDGAPIAGAWVSQGGRPDDRVATDGAGIAHTIVDRGVVGDLYVVATHAEARNAGVAVPEAEASVDVHLIRFNTYDNEAYTFQPAGSAHHGGDNTNECAHCHVTLVADWERSAHRGAAANPHVQHLYAGTSAWKDEASCRAAGGRWWLGIAPGSREPAVKCYVGQGALAALDPTCGVTSSCDGVATSYGGCADCHAPAIDGVIGGRDLLEATGVAYDEGVTCDLCHKVVAVDLEAPGHGIGGPLQVLRPSEPSFSPLFGAWSPLMFGPYPDVLNPLMGAVQSDLFAGADLCGGCHELRAPVLVPGQGIDLDRWPDGTLPIQTTWSEWKEGPFAAAGVACPACHMPPAPDLGNSADLYTEFHDVLVGVSAGWERAPGAVRHHSWLGPRQPESGLLELAATMSLDVARDDVDVLATVVVRNSGAGHALPTGEPMRQLLLVVDATCDGAPLRPNGGDAVPPLGGAWDTRDDPSRWPDAAPGQWIVALDDAGWREDPGPGPFGDGTFVGPARGLVDWRVAGVAEVLAVGPGGQVTLDAALPPADRYVRTSGGPAVDGAAPEPLAGRAGFAWARVLVDEAGDEVVPHFVATDVVRDNRLVPGAETRSTHRFAGPCDAPSVTARLVYRAFPPALVRERGWAVADRIIAEVTR